MLIIVHAAVGPDPPPAAEAEAAAAAAPAVPWQGLSVGAEKVGDGEKVVVLVGAEKVGEEKVLVGAEKVGEGEKVVVFDPVTGERKVKRKVRKGAAAAAGSPRSNADGVAAVAVATVCSGDRREAL